MVFGQLFRFHEVFGDEIASINRRRATANPPRRPASLEPEPMPQVDEAPVLRPTEDSEVVGLALSGGGVRSAAVCLGALQALHETGVLSRIDYLSTVSGGGYIGASLSAGMHATGGAFPFESRLAEDEVPAIQHLRDYSNYLFPRAEFALLHNVAIYTRGLVANVILIMPILLICAAVTIASNPNAPALLVPNIFGFHVKNYFSFDNFVVTAYLGLILLVVIIVWGWVRSRRDGSDVGDHWTSAIGWFVLLVVLVAFCESQPFILHEMFEPGTGHRFFGVLATWVQSAAAALAPLAAAVAFLGRKLGEFVKSATESTRTRDQIYAYAGTALIYIAALFVPLLLWALYLQLSYWGVCLGTAGCKSPPAWLRAAAGLVPYHGGLAGLYVIVAILFLVFTVFLRPNANSLHPLYRDRLSKAFLFKPQSTLPPGGVLAPLRLKLSELSEEHAPYHLINAALNVQRSKVANRRGRNADFFVFSRNFVGGKSTQYVRTTDMEQVMPELDLGTAMAVSGAAASSEMGAATIKPLTPTLAMLNIRLGYWLRNPKWVEQRGGWNRLANFYFVAEMLGLLSENRKSVYLTDGGHIENLGLYGLLKRRCKVIIVVDAEADPQMAFGSLVTLERYVRIDLGVLINLPWQQISNIAKETGETIEKTGNAVKKNGPHCAIGEIIYPGKRTGVLIYIKASLTGDESDYVFHYKKRYAAFPHETTLDQLFTEEQYEVYRTLGFHMAYRLFNRTDAFAHLDPKACPELYNELDVIDRLFPRVGAGGERQHFKDWILTEKNQ